MLRVISLGAGVQSSTLALMAASGEIEAPDCAIFADTQNEPRHSTTLDPQTGRVISGGIYGWLDWLEPRLPFPLYRVTRGDLMADSCEVKLSGKSGKHYLKALIPAFLKHPNGEMGLLGRKCTADYKIAVVQKKMRELLGVSRGGNEVLAETWIGISLDEAIRMKPSMKPYITHRWPLIEMRLTRQDCLNWMARHNYPIPPRSACVACPFHNDAEWKNLKEHSPKDFAIAVKIERMLQEAATKANALKGVPYLHSSGIPIDQVDFDTINQDGQLDMFMNECEGMCGV